MAKARTTQEAKEHPTLHERMLKVSQKASYVHRDAAPEKDDGTVIYTAATFDAIVAKLRPVLVENGVLAYPDHESFEAKVIGNNGQYAGLFVRVGIRFVNADDPADFFVVPGCAMGTANKYSPEEQLAGRLQTYAYKGALRYALLLETGDDPDFEAARGGAEVPPEIQERIDRINELSLAKHQGGGKPAQRVVDETDAYIRNVLDGYAREYNRPRILTLAGLTAPMLDKWLKQLDVPPAPSGKGAKKAEASGTTPDSVAPAVEVGSETTGAQAAAPAEDVTKIPPAERGAKIIAWLSVQRGDVPQGTIRNAWGGWRFHAGFDSELTDDKKWAEVWGRREEILADLDKREVAKA